MGWGVLCLCDMLLKESWVYQGASIFVCVAAQETALKPEQVLITMHCNKF